MKGRDVGGCRNYTVTTSYSFYFIKILFRGLSGAAGIILGILFYENVHI